MSNVVLFQSISRSAFQSHYSNVMAGRSQNQDGSSRDREEVSPRDRIAQEMHEIVRMAGEDGGPVIKGCIALASRRLGLPFSKTRKIWYREHCVIAAHEADMLRAARHRILGERARRLQAQLEVTHARMRALEGGRDEAVA